MNTYLSTLLLCLLTTIGRADDAPLKVEVTPDRVKSSLGELEKLTKQTQKSTGVPGIAITVIHRDQVVYKQGFGVREAGKPDRIDADTVFQVASMSKPIAPDGQADGVLIENLNVHGQGVFSRVK